MESQNHQAAWGWQNRRAALGLLTRQEEELTGWLNPLMESLTLPSLGLLTHPLVESQVWLTPRLEVWQELQSHQLLELLSHPSLV